MNNLIKNILEKGIIRATLKYNKIPDRKTGRFSSIAQGGTAGGRKERVSKKKGYSVRAYGSGLSPNDIANPPESGKARSYALMPLSQFSNSNAYGGTVTRNEKVTQALADMDAGTVVGGWTKVSSGNQTFWKKGSQTLLTLPDSVLNQSLHKSIVMRSISNGTLSPQKAVSIHKSTYPDISNWPAMKRMLGLTSVSTKALLKDYIKKGMQVRDYQKAAPFLGKNVHPVAREKILGLLRMISPNTPVGALALQDKRRASRMKINLSKLLTLPYKKSSQTSGGKTSVIISLQNPDKNDPDMYVPQNKLGSYALQSGGWLNRDRFITAYEALNLKEHKESKSISESVLNSLKTKVKEHNKKYGKIPSKRVTLSMLEQVFRRGVGAYQTNPGSVRPNVTGPDQWAHARVNTFLAAIRTGRYKNKSFDTDVLPKKHPLSSRKSLKELTRNYRKEYDTYHGTPEQKSHRNKRNKARRQLGLVKGDGLEAHHKVPMSKGGGNGNGNIQSLTFAENRKRGSKSNGK